MLATPKWKLGTHVEAKYAASMYDPRAKKTQTRGSEGPGGQAAWVKCAALSSVKDSASKSKVKQMTYSFVKWAYDLNRKFSTKEK